MPPLLFSPLEDPPVSDLWFQCVSAFLCGFCLAACSDPINSWPLTHTVNKHIEPSDFFFSDLVSSSVCTMPLQHIQICDVPKHSHSSSAVRSYLERSKLL